jgi:O-antigen/teichoic acid export membrane protein
MNLSDQNDPGAQGLRRIWTVSLYGFATALPRISGAFLAILYASVFSLEEYGAFGVLSVTILPLSALMDLGNVQAIMRNFYDHQHDWSEARRFLANIIYSSDIAALLIFPLLTIALYLSWGIFGLESNHVLFYVTIVVGIALFDRSVTMLSVVLRVAERPIEYALGPLADTIVSILCGVVFVMVFDWGVAGAMLAALAGRVVSFLIYRLILHIRLGIRGGRMDWRQIASCFSFGLPLLLSQLANWARESGLRPILTLVAPLGYVGLFSLASSLAALPLQISVAIDMALSPYYLKQRTSRSDDFEQRMHEFGKVFLACMVPIWGGLILFSRELIDLFAGHRYADAGPICAILLCASFVRMQQPFLIRQIHFLRRTWLQSAVTIPFAVCSMALSMILTATFGITQAAWGVLVAEVGCLLAFGYIIHKVEPLHYPMGRSMCLSALLSLLALATISDANEMVGEANFMTVKFAVLAAITLWSAAFWVWPNRRFIATVMK